jgi:RimJ/RimL family protein N-acetyltransferase
VIVERDGLRLRRAGADDVDFMLALVGRDDVEPFLAAVRVRDREELLEEIERSRQEPAEVGRFVVEVEQEGEWLRAGVMAFDRRNRRSRIAHLGGLALLPDFRGQGIADDAARLLQRHLLFDLEYHRLELECYGFNEHAIDHAERSGFIREGVRRRAYWRHGEWVDGVLFGLLREDLEDESPKRP